jgi:hypothetical protein
MKAGIRRVAIRPFFVIMNRMRHILMKKEGVDKKDRLVDLIKSNNSP